MYRFAVNCKFNNKIGAEKHATPSKTITYYNNNNPWQDSPQATKAYQTAFF